MRFDHALETYLHEVGSEWETEMDELTDLNGQDADPTR